MLLGHDGREGGRKRSGVVLGGEERCTCLEGYSTETCDGSRDWPYRGGGPEGEGEEEDLIGQGDPDEIIG